MPRGVGQQLIQRSRATCSESARIPKVALGAQFGPRRRDDKHILIGQQIQFHDRGWWLTCMPRVHLIRLANIIINSGDELRVNAPRPHQQRCLCCSQAMKRSTQADDRAGQFGLRVRDQVTCERRHWMAAKCASCGRYHHSRQFMAKLQIPLEIHANDIRGWCPARDPSIGPAACHVPLVVDTGTAAANSRSTTRNAPPRFSHEQNAGGRRSGLTPLRPDQGREDDP
jgi:hypothetical protein